MDTKQTLHQRNKHQGRYDFEILIETHPNLAQYVAENKYGNDSIDFFNAAAVKALNTALLKHHYSIEHWDIPENYLCPPIPGRADYIHHIADVLAKYNSGNIPIGSKIVCLDVGVGANCIYPIVGNSEYDWSFIGSEIDKTAAASARKIVASNKKLSTAIDIRLQENKTKIFSGIIHEDEKVDVAMCNPPFHASAADATKASLRKLSNLKGKKITTSELNFGGRGNELWTKGGEKRFIKDMIHESKHFGKSCCWFSTLVSRNENLETIYDVLDKVSVTAYETVAMGHGNKISRLVAWTFLSETEMEIWAKERWG